MPERFHRQIVTAVLTTVGVRSNQQDRECAAENVAALLEAYTRATRTPEQAEAEAREVLRELSDKFNGVDSGTCTICHGHRLCDTKGNVGPCENKTCLSHRITAALLASGPTAKNLENLKRRLLERLHERFARREELKTLLDEEFSRSEPKEKV